MDKNEIDLLLEKYLNGSISPEEAVRLRRLSNLCDDDELKKVFSEHWERYQDSPENSSLEIRDIPDLIHKRICATPKKSLVNVWMRIAVSVLLLVTTGLSIYLMVENNQMTLLGEREITTRVDKGQRANITLPDGTTIQLNSESVVSYKQDFGKQDRQIKFSGEGFFQVTKDPEKKFRINTQFMDVEVLGTSFNFYAYESKDIVEVTLVEGRVFLSTHTSPSQEVTLEPNNKAIYDKSTGKLQVKPTTTTFETAWRATELVFRSEPLSEVLQKIERRYGVICHIENEQLLKETYTGVFDKEDLREVMEILRTHFGFTYRVSEDTVLIK